MTISTRKEYWTTCCPTLFIYQDGDYIGWVHLQLDGVDEEDDTRDELANRLDACETIEQAQEVCEDMFYTLRLL